MKNLTAQKIKLLVVGFAALMTSCPGLLSPGAAVSSDTNQNAPIGSIRDQNLIAFKRGPLDTSLRVDLDTSGEDRQAMSGMSVSASKRTRIVQFGGSIRPGWINSLRVAGAEIVGYIPHNAYIIRGSPSELARVAGLHAGADWEDARPIRWMGRLLAVQKLDPAYTDEMLSGASRQDVDVEIELADSSDSATAIEVIIRSASSINSEPRMFLNFVVLSVRLRVDQLLDIAGLDEVLYVSPAPKLKLHDERSAQIVAGNLSADGTQPSGPGYLAWLTSKGLDGEPDFVIDFTDSGLDRGSTSAIRLHPDFLDSALRSRVAYIFNYATDGLIDDRPGHGTIVASVAGGQGQSSREDASGYMYGLGVDPFARLGASRIFDERNRLPSQLSFTGVASAAYSAGARMSNNSWGNLSNTYDATAQEYDALVRDAQPSVSGNQEMIFVFSAGNAGAGGHVGSPGTAKNVISVAASENYRPEGFDSCDLDGGGVIGPDGADSALDILRFSSGGPTADGRAKPDIAAPGTHVYGAASQSPGFFGEGLCAGRPVFQPPNQSLYTWSSGTSFAAPHISGAASLVRRFFLSRNLLGDGRPPSPAMTKAYLINSASYMTGENASGDLPGERQGWGLVDLSRSFDGATRALVDQTRLFTESGQILEVQGSLADRSLPLRVTLDWTDAPGSLVGPAIVNDLDLEIIVGGVTVYRGNNFAGAYSVEEGEPDRLNNVESIYLPPAAIPQGFQGNFTITVRAANIAGDGVPGNGTSLDQDFALVIYNIAQTVQPPPPPPPKKVPVIAGAAYVKKTLTVTGHAFTAAAQVEINGSLVERTFDFNSATNSLSLRLKRRKLNLNDEADNQIVLIENGERSQPFVLRL
ncbi:MAG: S8 family serine peptidase [Acidobacteriota bacterium]